jgi:hypothetical protein
MNDDLKKPEAEEAAQQAELEQLASAAAGDEQPVSGEWQPGPEQAGRQSAPGPKTADVIAPLLLISFGLIAARKGAHWALSEPEATEAAAAYAEVLDKYAPDVAIGPEFTAIMVTAMLVAPRLGEDKRQEVKRRKEQADKQGADDGDQAE